ncbi:hypothetical protein P4O66_004283 [Electrophorus voltai]|uniref:Ig-like domain-containing protein n=1 Tax=Electrophorus voltai TaxID=2609070 RepID=A0AAD9E359_9TELE|nr:hypothetical protein P4O66_004283 [Electrophorus voltai]
MFTWAYGKLVLSKENGKVKMEFSFFFTDLQVDTPETVVEGDDVTVTCKTSCSLTGPTFIWYKNGNNLTSNSNALHLYPVSREDAGSYSCALLGQNHQSPGVTLDVRYPPKNVSVSITTSGEIVEGSSVILTCSSNANPPVQIYTWFIEGGTSPVGSGQNFTVLPNGSYYCVAQNEYGSQSAGAISISVTFKGTVGQNGWDVNYSPKSICALTGSTVTMGCTYTYPSGYVIVKTFWSTELVKSTEPPDLSLDTKYSYRVQYLGDKQSTCTLRLRDVTEQDQRKYYFRFITNTATGKWQGQDGVQLFVTDLQVDTPETVVEGDNVTVTCKTSCSLTGPTFIWCKNGNNLTSNSNALHLYPVSREDAGSYSCALLGQNHQSPGVTLDVRYPPKNVSVSISPAGEIVEGSSVTLTCSSNANPPVQNYTWFKGTSFQREGKNYSINNISSVDSGEYKCNSSNAYGETSSNPVTVNVLYPPKNVSVSISPAGEIVEGSSVTLTCSSNANPPVQNYTWFKGTSFQGEGKNYSINNISSVDSGEYKCNSSNAYGETSSNPVTVNVLYPPKNVSVSISPSGEIVEGSSVTLTCSSDANPPVQNYTWFIEGGTSPVGSGQNFRVLHSGSYYCEAQNKYGSQSASVVSVTFKEVKRFILYAVVGLIAGWLFIITAILIISNAVGRDTTHDPTANPDLANQDEVQYASITHQSSTNPRKDDSPSAKAVEEVQYASVQHHHDNVEKTQENDIHYANLRFAHNSPPNRASVIRFGYWTPYRKEKICAVPGFLYISEKWFVAEGGWNVNYRPNFICALNVSTMTMGCTYTYPSGYVIVKTFWSTELVKSTEPADLSLDPEYRDRVEYLGDKQSTCTLILRDVTEQDQRKYNFRFITNTATGKCQGQDGVQLFVTGQIGAGTKSLLGEQPRSNDDDKTRGKKLNTTQSMGKGRTKDAMGRMAVPVACGKLKLSKQNQKTGWSCNG